MNFKSNLNRIHYLLSEKYENIKVVEKSNQKLGPYIELTVKENLECKIIIKKPDLENNNLMFSYLSNPIDESSDISRISSIEGFAETIKDIIDNKRFDSEYLDSVK